MYQFVFKSRWIALGLVALTLLGVYMLVGRGGVLPGMSSNLAGQQAEQAARVAEIEAPPKPPETSWQDEPEYVLMSDEELIDDAKGFDPTPADSAEDAPGETAADDAPDGGDDGLSAPRYAPDGVQIIMRDR